MINLLLYIWSLCRCSRASSFYPAVCEPIKFGTDTGFVYRTYLNTYHVVIDGSSTALEWVEDFIIFKVGRWFSHIGFDNVAEGMYSDVLSALTKLGANKLSKICFDGHSRGGPIAALLNMRFLEAKYANTHTYTYGSPKYGGLLFNLFAKSMGLRLTRVFIKEDIVTKLPPSPLWPHYATDTVELKKHPKSSNKAFDVHHMYGTLLTDLIR